MHVLFGGVHHNGTPKEGPLAASEVDQQAHMVPSGTLLGMVRDTSEVARASLTPPPLLPAIPPQRSRYVTTSGQVVAAECT
jgi:hypothetical protein